MSTTAFKIRKGPTPFYERLTNLVGQYLWAKPNIEVSTSQVHKDFNEGLDKEMYTLNQIRRALDWQVANNPEFKQKMVGYQGRYRIYCYEPDPTVSE